MNPSVTPYKLPLYASVTPYKLPLYASVTPYKLPLYASVNPYKLPLDVSTWGSVAVFQCHPFLSQGVLFHLTGRKDNISFCYISLFLYNDFMFEYYIIFPSFSLNDIYWIYVFVYIYSQFQKQADLLLYITGRCLCWSCLHYHHGIVGFDVMMLLLSFRAIWNLEARHK